MMHDLMWPMEWNFVLGSGTSRGGTVIGISEVLFLPKELVVLEVSPSSVGKSAKWVILLVWGSGNARCDEVRTMVLGFAIMSSALSPRVAQPRQGTLCPPSKNSLVPVLISRVLNAVTSSKEL